MKEFVKNNLQSKYCLGSATGNTFFLALEQRPERIDYRAILHRFDLDSALFVNLEGEENAHLFFRMSVWERDGSQSAFCGNGSRAIARLLDMTLGNTHRYSLLVDSGKIALNSHAKGYSFSCSIPRVEESLHLENHLFYLIYALGEPHLVTLDPLTDAELTSIGKKVNKLKLFAHTVNLNTISIAGPHLIANKTYERGVERITSACGSGSLSAYAVAKHLSQIANTAVIENRGGAIWIDTEGENATMAGQAHIYSV